MSNGTTFALVALVLGGGAILAFSPKAKPMPAAAALPEHAAIIDDVDLGGGARLRVIEIPDRIMSYRCVILTADGRSTMHCPADAAP